MKDLDDVRERCKSAVPSNERNSNTEQRIRPKSSLGSAMTRASSASKSASSLNSSYRPKSSKGTRSEKKKVEQQTSRKKSNNKIHHKYRQVSNLDDNDPDDDDDEENDIHYVEDEELDDEDSGKSNGDDEEEDDEEPCTNKENSSNLSVPLVTGEQVARDPVDLSTEYEQFFDEMVDLPHTLRSKMSQTFIDRHTENLLSRIFRNSTSPSSVTPQSAQSICSFQQMPSNLHFQIYSMLAKFTTSAYQFTKLAYPDAFSALSDLRHEPIQKCDERNARTTLLSDIRRILYPPSVFNRIVFDFDTMINNSTTCRLDNDDEQRCQRRSNVDHLLFDSQFECGNLRKAIQITDEEYDLILRPDVNTFRHHQWFYFEVSNMRRDLIYRFNIINFEKMNSQFNAGMQPVMFSVCDALHGKSYWRRIGEKISYYKNTYGKKKKIFYTLTFNIQFTHDNDICYIAYHYPYTYTTLMTDLINWSKTYNRSNIYFRQQILCKTLSGNDCPLLTITSLNNQNDLHENERQQTIPLHRRSYIILTARVHPGESNASWIMKGLIDYLLSDELTARILRDRYIFKIIPMLNPDGVINGCQRCSLATRDLNRQWSSPNPTLFPTIYHTKGLISYLSVCCSQPISLFCDFHGHSRQKNFFFYGNDPRLHFLGPAVGRSTIPKIFPKLFTGVPGFAIQNCLFTIRKQKEGCARIVIWDEFKIDLAYTMEATYNGFDVGIYKGLQIQISTLQRIGHDFCRVLVKLVDQDLKPAENFVPLEELFVPDEAYSEDKRAANGGAKQRSPSIVSSSSSSTCSFSSTDKDLC